jgi:gliding motility-associated-like protein
MKILLTCLVPFLTLNALGQCLTEFENVYPDRTPSYSESFGNSVSVYGDILAVGASASDSLGLEGAGIVYLYQKAFDGTWNSIGILKPSVPIAQKGFGSIVRATQHYILVGSRAINSGIYIFKKPLGGWSTTTETALLKPSGSIGFGYGFDISEDEQTIVGADISYASSIGAFYVFHKQPADEWTNLAPSQVVVNPDPGNNNLDFGLGGVRIVNDRIACATVGGFFTTYGSVYMFQDASGTFSNYQYEAKLTEGSGSTGSYGPTFEFTDEGVFKYINGNILFYQAPTSGVWPGGGETCAIPIQPVDGLSVVNFYVNYQASGDSLYVSARLQDNTGRVLLLRKSGSNWCSGVVQEVIYTEPAPTPGNSNLFVRSFSCYKQTEIALSWIFPDNTGSTPAVAVGVLSHQVDNSWTKQTILRSKADALNYNLGTALYHSGDFLLTTATNERTLDNKPRGAVYVFKKTGTDWNKVSKLTGPSVIDSDVGFGRFITGFGDYVAATAFQYTPSKIFIYQGSNGDLSSLVPIQTLAMPTGKFVDSYGSPVMNADWVIVPTLRQQSGVTASLFFFKKDNSGQWVFHSLMDFVGVLGNLVFKLPPTLSMEGGTLAASNGYDKVYLLEFDSVLQTWKINYSFQASDPDADPFFGSVTVNGSFFGTALKLTERGLFVGASGKNYDTTADVGAIYIFLRNAQGGWVSGVENVKLLPVNKIAKTSFGFSLDVLDNTLVTGAVNSTSAGQAFVIQSQDYNWQNTIPLLTLTGVTSGIDYFGFTVALDQDHFFIGASRESNAVAIGAGTVYITTPPPLIKLEPPVCTMQVPFNLKGYPFNGVWGGAGITAPVTGTFDPALAGVGVHMLTYQTPNCFYVGHLQIEVVSAPTGQTIGVKKDTVCAVGKTQVVLSVPAEQNVSYQWYYRTDSAKPYIPNSNTTPQITVTNAALGQYKLEARVLTCSILHEFEVTKESLQVSIDAIPDICDPFIQTVPLISNFSGGIWSLGSGPNSAISQSPPALLPPQLADGSYSVTYVYTSHAGCIYQASRPFVIDLLSTPIVISSGDWCSGSLHLSVDDLDSGTTLEWFKDNSGTPFSQLSSIAITLSGDYFVKALKKTCSATSEIFPVQPVDTLSKPIVISSGDLCSGSLHLFVADLESGATLEWFKDNSPIPISQLPSFPITSSGDYFVRALKPRCSATSEIFHVESVADSLFIPNVITANGDSFNDQFEVRSENVQDFYLEVMNRYGKLIFTTQEVSFKWSANDVSSGTYFWYARYSNCTGEVKIQKGWLNVLK